ncbi:adhesion G-protein coupled receptor G1 isoform X1 [Hemibagrus wyckioides]|nr:adhesion G-protein coupled receptor G1 isoform X1 [Hemibagrus wyckioides]
MDQRVGFLLLVLTVTVHGHAATEGDRDFKMCGIWKHQSSSQTLDINLKSGCSGINISANASVLSIHGSIMANCKVTDRKSLTNNFWNSSFCVIWEPLLDQLVVEVNSEKIPLCNSTGLQTTCCAHLSAGTQSLSKEYGIQYASVHGDRLSDNIMASYNFQGESINCKEYFCSKIAQESRAANMLEEVVMRSKEVGSVFLPCGQSTIIMMKEGFAGNNVTLPAPRGTPQERIPLVHLPACLKPKARKTAKVVCSYYKNSTFFQKPSQKILEDVVGISVENEIITNLPEPVRIKFQHPTLEKTHSRRCVSWDTRQDKTVMWRETGCVTLRLSVSETECCCSHLTYFAILVDVNPTRNLRHLEALTFITAVCCAVSIVSCAVLFISLCRQRKSKNQSSLVHRGLVVALFFLLVLFVLSGTVANVTSDSVCGFMGGLLHYTLISVLCWMAVEVIHTFWMMYMVFNPPPQPWIWYLLGFGVPAVPVLILGCMGDIYGRRTVKSDDELTTPYRMCWMKETRPALVAHFVINTGLLAALASSGLVMLYLVFRKIRHRDEWRRNRVAFLSIWGLSCLFGSTWVLAFFSSEPSETVLFLFCIINSLQGLFLMLRFFALEKIQKNSESSSDFSSTGSTRQHMLQPQDRN